MEYSKKLIKKLNLSISIVTHGHVGYVEKLLEDIQNFLDIEYEVFVVNNKPSIPIDFKFDNKVFHLINNKKPKGFGRNHNYSFLRSKYNYFLVLNPDTRIKKMSSRILIESLIESQAGVVSPIVLNPDLTIQKNARSFPSFLTPLYNYFSQKDIVKYDNRSPFISVDWISGAVMLFKREVFKECNGFDEKYYMYYEDVDICKRIKKLGFKVILNTKTSAIHYGQRKSHKNLIHLFWHLKSHFRFALTKS